jgi:GTP cyclohydrolase I
MSDDILRAAGFRSLDESMFIPGPAKALTFSDVMDPAAECLIAHTGLDMSTEHGKDTPKRFAQMLEDLTACKYSSGEHMETCIKWKTFESTNDEMIVVQDITFTSVCNHHVVPFMGVAHVAYVPHRRIAGLSKFARVVRHFARRLQVQEQLTTDIADYLGGHLEPAGVGVIIKAEHLCMTIRGVESPGTKTTTSAMRGVFADHARTAKAEFLSFIR